MCRRLPIGERYIRSPMTSEVHHDDRLFMMRLPRRSKRNGTLNLFCLLQVAINISGNQCPCLFKSSTISATRMKTFGSRLLLSLPRRLFPPEPSCGIKGYVNILTMSDCRMKLSAYIFWRVGFFEHPMISNKVSSSKQSLQAQSAANFRSSPRLDDLLVFKLSGIVSHGDSIKKDGRKSANWKRETQFEQNYYV